MTKRLAAAVLAAGTLVAALLTAGGFVELHAAQRALAAENYAAAADQFEAAAAHLFWRRDLWTQAANSALMAGDAPRVIRLLGTRPNLDEPASIALAQAYVQLGLPDAALETYEAAIRANGGSAALHAGQAEIYRTQGNYVSERIALENLLSYDPEDAGANYRLGLLLVVDDADAALDHLRRAAAADERFGPAAQTLRTAILLAAEEPEPARQLVTIGRGLGLVSEWQLAAEAFDSAVGIDGQDAEAWAWLGEAKQHLGDDGRAELDTALKLDRDSVVVHAMRGLYWKRVGNEQEALAEYQAAALLEPQNPTWKTALGESYARLGDLVSALSVYQRATELAPDDTGVWRLLATFCVEYGVQIQAIGMPAAQQAVLLAPEDALALDVLGWNQLAAGWFVSAETSLLSAIENDPELATAHLHLAMTYLQTGDRVAAHEHLIRVQELDTQGPFGQQAAMLLAQNFPE